MSDDERDKSPPRNVDNLPSCSDTESSDPGASRPPRGLSIEEKLFGKMFEHAREICFFLVVFFTALAAFHTSPPKVSKPPTARPFFNQSSAVLDFYKGHLGAVLERVTDADFSFVMYYAPWDAECQAVRHEFESVARYHHAKIFFAAVNCWHPGSECRAQYSKIQSYPVLMLYPSRESGVQYRGIRTAPYMIRFLDAFIEPIRRITSREQLAEVLVDNDAVVVGFFNFTRPNKSPGYKEFHKTALRSLERDPNRDLVFAAVTDALSASRDYGVLAYPSASLLMWNESLSYPAGNEWTSENLLNWVNGALHQVALWLQPPGSKALTLAPFLRDGPVLFLFTPRNPLHSKNYNYNLIREVGLRYYNCGDNPLIDEMIERLSSNRRKAKIEHYNKTKECIRLLNRRETPSASSPLSVSVQQWINDSCCAKVVMNKCLLCKEDVATTVGKDPTTCASSRDLGRICEKREVFDSPVPRGERDEYDFCCNANYPADDQRTEAFDEKRTKYETSMLPRENDPRSAASLMRSFSEDACKKLFLGNAYHQPVFPRDSKEHPDVSLTPSRCRVNKTLALIAIDSLQFSHFAEGLGIDISRRRDRTAAVILDSSQESQYVMKEELSRYSLVQFVNNYTNGLLRRTLRSDGSTYSSSRLEKRTRCDTKDASTICVPELTSETFLRAILDPGKDVVVMYHSPYCAFCSAVAYVYLTVAHYMSKMDHLAFFRIDGDNNDLPWEYTMNRYPSILFFPAKRKEDSTIFPLSLPITVPNLLNFVLANLEGDAYIEALVNVCEIRVGDSPVDCIARIRWLCLSVMEELLRDYRRLRRNSASLDKRTAVNRRRTILLKLQHTKDVHLILSSISDLGRDREKVDLIRDKYAIYYRNLSHLRVNSEAENNELKVAGDGEMSSNFTGSGRSKDEL